MVGESMLKFLKEVGRADIAVFFVKGKLLCSTKKLWKVMHQVKCPLGEWIQKPGIACGERYAWFLGQVEYHQLKQIQNVMKLLLCYFECTKLCFIQAISYLFNLRIRQYFPTPLYPESLTDPFVRFSLAVELHDLDLAVDSAHQLDSKGVFLIRIFLDAGSTLLPGSSLHIRPTSLSHQSPLPACQRISIKVSLLLP